jgi:hypothetical protein
MGVSFSTMCGKTQPTADYHATPADHRVQIGATGPSPAPGGEHPAFPGLTRPPRRTSVVGDDKYSTFGMLKSAHDADMEAKNTGIAVPYLDAHERAEHEVEVRDGKLYRQGVPMNNSHDDMFVMDGKGKVYAADPDKLEHHSSFFSGGPVAAAGTMKVTSGTLTHFSDQSGHYQPTTEHSQQFLEKMSNNGVDLSQVKKSFYGLSKAQLAEQGISTERIYPNNLVVTKPY